MVFHGCVNDIVREHNALSIRQLDLTVDKLELVVEREPFKLLGVVFLLRKCKVLAPRSSVVG